MNNWKQTSLPILLMFAAMLLDGFITSYWTSALDTNLGLVVPRTIVLVIIILTFHYKQNFMLGSVTVIWVYYGCLLFGLFRGIHGFFNFNCYDRFKFETNHSPKCVVLYTCFIFGPYSI